MVPPPNSLYSTPEYKEEWRRQCEREGEHDVRHLGRYLTFGYTCPNCEEVEIELPPEYPYCGANSTDTCPHCAAVMRLNSPIPVSGIPKLCMTTKIRNSA